MLIGHIITFCVFILLMTLTPNCGKDSPCYTTAFFGLTFYAISFSLWYQIYAVMFRVIDKKVQQTGYGLMVCFVNLGYMVIPIVIGIVHDATKDNSY